MILPVEVAGWLLDPANWSGPDGIATRLGQHLVMTVVAVGIAAAIAVPTAIWLGHLHRGHAVVVNLAGVGRAIPTYALLVLLAIGPLGLGMTSTIVALVLFAIPPLLVNTHSGVSEVDQEVVQAARGMGMSGWQVVRQIEVPLAAPLLLTGFRQATVQVIATATIAALVAGGGLGRIITAGFGRQDQVQLVAGAVLVALVALAAEGGFGLGAAWLRRRSRSDRNPGVPVTSTTST